jgi:cell division septation protein DedD
VKHTMFTFQLHRTGVVLVILGAFLLGILIFAGGYLAGMRRAAPVPALSLTKPAVPKPAVPTVPKPALPPVARPALPSLALFGRQTPVAAADAAGTAPAAAAPEPDVFVLRAGLFTSNEEAAALVQQLAARKLTATVSKSKTMTGPVLYSVHVGRYATRREAAVALDALRRDSGIEGAIELLQPEPIDAVPPAAPTATTQ